MSTYDLLSSPKIKGVKYFCLNFKYCMDLKSLLVEIFFAGHCLHQEINVSLIVENFDDCENFSDYWKLLWLWKLPWSRNLTWSWKTSDFGKCLWLWKTSLIVQNLLCCGKLPWLWTMPCIVENFSEKFPGSGKIFWSSLLKIKYKGVLRILNN